MSKKRTCPECGWNIQNPNCGGCDYVFKLDFKNLVYKPRSIGATGAKMSQAEKELKRLIFNQEYPNKPEDIFKTNK